MMRRGPLEDYPVDQILRLAADERLTGSIEIRSSVSGLVFFDQGLVVSAVIEGAPVSPETMPVARPPSQWLRTHLISVLTTLLLQEHGWYHQHAAYHPLGQDPDGVRIRVPVGELLGEVSSRLQRDIALHPWGTRLVTPHAEGAADGGVHLDRDAWALVAAIAHPAAVHQLTERLGWDAARVAATLRRLEGVGLLAPVAPPVAVNPPTETPPPPAPPIQLRPSAPEITLRPSAPEITLRSPAPEIELLPADPPAEEEQPTTPVREFALLTADMNEGAATWDGKPDLRVRPLPQRTPSRSGEPRSDASKRAARAREAVPPASAASVIASAAPRSDA